MARQVMQLEGAREIEKLLVALPKELSDKAVNKALRAGGKPIKDDIFDRAPHKSGDYRKAIVIRKSTRRRKRFQGGHFVIGVKRPWYRLLHLLEWGHRGAPAKPHWRPALQTKAPEAIKIMQTIMLAEVLKTAERLSGKFRTSGLARRSRRRRRR